MHQTSHKVYGDISFVEHSIPNVSVTTYSSGKIYYHHQEHIYLYNLSNRSHIQLHQMQECSEMFIIRNVLCAVHANLLKVFEKEPRELRLKEIPRKIILSNDSVENKDGVGFLYEDSIEIFNLGRYPIRVVDVPSALGIVDFANAGDTTYILDKEGQVLKSKSIFLTHQIMSAVLLTVVPKTTRVYNGIFAYNDKMFLMAVDSCIEKYDVGDRSLVLEYSYTFQSRRNAIVKSGFLLGEHMVHLSNAPILVLSDQVHNVFQLSGDSLMGITAGRIYFIGEVPKLPTNKLSYELHKHNLTINPNSIEIPEFIKDQQQIDQFMRNETLLRGCEAVLEQIQSIGRDLERRESELEAQRTELESEIEKMEEKRKAVEERIHRLVERARKVRVKGSLDGFYKRIEALEREMELVSTKDLSGLKEKLKAQRAVLREKIR